MRDCTKINKKADLALNIVMILCTIACVLPLIIVFSASITEEKSVTMYGYSMLPREFSLESYKYIFKNIGVVLRAYGVTMFVTVVGSTLSLIIISLYAYPISRKDFKYRNVFTFIVFLTMLFNGGLVPWYMVYVNVLHINDTVMALILPYLMTPLYVLIMRTFFMTSIPEGIIEAAKIDGAGEFQTFVRIVLPLAKPALATIGLFNVLTYWNDWYAPLLFINNEKLFNLQYLMYRVDKAIMYLSNNASSINNATQIMTNLPSQTARMAMAVVAIGPIILAYPFFQKYFVEGLTIGSIKG
jgi:putative aldouronate transport system permease protein